MNYSDLFFIENIVIFCIFLQVVFFSNLKFKVIIKK